MKKLFTLAAVLIGLAGYQPNTQALPTLDVDFSQGGTGNWNYALDINPVDLSLGTLYAVQIDSLILGGAGLQPYNGGHFVMSGGVLDLQDPMFSVGVHTVILYYNDFNTTAPVENYTIIQPTGVRPGTTVPDTSSTLGMASIGLITLFVLRRKANWHQANM